jgi:hypothetical protein
MGALHKATVPSLYILVFESERRFHEIQNALYDQGWTSEAVVDFPTRGMGRTYAGIVINPAETITHLCRMVRLRTAALNRRTVGLSEFEKLSSDDSHTLKQTILGSRTGPQRHELPITSLDSLTRAENGKIIERLDRVAPALSDKLREKGKTDDRILAPYTEHERQIMGLERDAIGLALDIAFADREGLVVDAAHAKHSAFVSMLSVKGYTKDEIILHEKDRFPGLIKLRGATPRVTEFEQNGSTLRVIHANRNDLEHTLGVDLMYISEFFGLLVGVQYKMMNGAPPHSHFSPTKDFKNQLEKMSRIWSKLKTSSVSRQIDYRLNNIPFYFKFVSRLERNFSDDKLCPGMYLPIDLALHITSSVPPQKIGTKHRTRHLSNTEFANLVRQGWIGADSKQTKVLENMVDDALDDNRSVTVAIQAGAPLLR